jgi:hypothetical protein
MEGAHTAKRKPKTSDEALSDKAPKITKHMTSVYVPDGGECELHCELGDTSIFDVVWLHNNKEIKPSTDFQYIKDKNTLKLKIAEIFPEGMNFLFFKRIYTFLFNNDEETLTST